MFDTITGLPLHPLVIHGVVVGVPLMAVVTILVAVRRNLRERYSWWVAGANSLLFLLTLVAKESGEALQEAKGGQTGHRARSAGQRPAVVRPGPGAGLGGRRGDQPQQGARPDRGRVLHPRGGRGGVLDGPHR